MSDYQGHATGYQTAKRQPWRTYLEQPSALALLGDLSGSSVLDLGCGEGHYTRLLRQLGADQVLGVDLSSDMVELARAQEKSHPLGIDYRVCDAAELKLQTTFDLVFAGYLFNHARNREELRAQFSTICDLLRPGGRLVALNNNPDDPPSNFEAGRPYGYSKSIDGPLVEGAAIHYRFELEDGGVFELTDYYISREVMQTLMEDCGLQQVHWPQPVLAEEGVEARGADYWTAIMATPPFCLIEATRT
ncbi:MAG: hypothetical protein CL859_06600 [Cyanobium sp. ARS6]|nr:hypothetical protein [Cyanobium sp. ARS6]